MTRALLCALCIAHCVLFAGACAKAKAASAADGPPLAVPAAPPRVLAPVDEPLAEAPLPQEQPATPPADAGRQPPTTRPTPQRRSAPVATAPAPAPEPPPDASASGPPATEQPAAPRAVTTPTDAAADRKVRDVLTKAARDLGGVDYKKLSTQGQAQYDQSKKYTDQAEAALRERNYAFAATLADKAGEIATQLLGSR